jgi:hypothetical protein
MGKSNVTSFISIVSIPPPSNIHNLDSFCDQARCHILNPPPPLTLLRKSRVVTWCQTGYPCEKSVLKIRPNSSCDMSKNSMFSNTLLFNMYLFLSLLPNIPEKYNFQKYLKIYFQSSFTKCLTLSE